MKATHPETSASAQSDRLLAWYQKNRRVLPWREDPTPYHVWISEIMLQQTRVEAVRRYYERFLERLPDIASLAEAEEDVYLKLWEGLGYYRRVQNMHRAAVQIMETRDGEMPATYQELKQLAGIGDYTAAAIASIAFGEPVPAVDGNLLRIFSRMTAYESVIDATGAKKDAFHFFAERIPQDRPGDFNQALMDLGAMVCLPNGAPHCDVCPWEADCLAHKTGTETDYPKKKKKKARVIEEKTVFLLRDHRRTVIRKRPASGLLAGLYEFPNTDGHLSEEEAARFVQSQGYSPIRIRSLPPVRHIFSHIEWHMTGYEILLDEWELEKMSRPQTSAHESFVQSEDTPLFLADLEEIRETRSIPSAFAAFLNRIDPDRE